MFWGLEGCWDVLGTLEGRCGDVQVRQAGRQGGRQAGRQTMIQGRHQFGLGQRVSSRNHICSVVQKPYFLLPGPSLLSPLTPWVSLLLQGLLSYSQEFPSALQGFSLLPEASHYSQGLPITPTASDYSQTSLLLRTIPYYSPVILISPRGSPLLSEAAYELPEIHDYSQVLPSTPRDSTLLPEAPNYSQRLPITPTGDLLLPEAPHYSERLSVTPKGSPFLPHAPDDSQRLLCSPPNSRFLPEALITPRSSPLLLEPPHCS